MRPQLSTGKRTGRTTAVVISMLFVVVAAALVFAQTGPAELVGRDEEHNPTAAEIRIFSQRPKPIFDETEMWDFEQYKQTQARLLKGFFVLQSALRQPEVARLELIRQQAKPVEWLEKNLHVSSPGTEFLRLTLRGDRSKEAATILNAVVDAYMKEVVGAEEQQRRQRLTELQKIAMKLGQEIESIRKQRRRQEEAMQASKPREPLLDLELVRNEYTRLWLRQNELEAVLKVAAKSGGQSDERAETESPSDLLEQELEVISTRVEALEDRLRPYLERVREVGTLSLDLTEFDRDLERKEKTLEHIHDKVMRLEIELDSPIGIEVFRKAEPGE